MPDTTIDSWLTSGGLDDEWVTLRNVRFAVDIEYRDGEVAFMQADLIPDDTDVTPREAQIFGCGHGWEAADDESGITRADGKRAQFNTQSKIGAFVASFLEAGGRSAVEARHKAGDQITPFDAAFYEGMHVLVKNNQASGTGDDGREFTWNYYTVAETDGYESGSGESKPAKKAAKKAPAKKAAAKKRAAKAEADETPAAKADDGIDIDAWRAKLVEHCNQSEAETHDDWMMEAYEAFDEIADSDDLQALVDDPDQVWAEVVG